MAARKGIRQVIQSVAQLFAEPATPAAVAGPSQKALEQMKVLSTGFKALDNALGTGGLPHQTLIELMGPGATFSSGGASLVAARIAARVQRQQEVVTIVDMHGSFDPWQAERAGLVAPQLLLTRPETIFDAVSTLEAAAKNARMVIVVMGIVAELLNHIDAATLAVLLRRLQTMAHHADCVFLLLTAPLETDPFSPKNYPPGFPLAKAAALRLWLQDEDWRFKHGMATAYKASLTVIKNQLTIAGKGANLRIKLNTP